MSQSLLDERAETGAVGPQPEVVGRMADRLGTLLHTVHRAKAQLLARHGDADWSSRAVVARIVVDGPKRVSDLADVTHTDVSTVSRQVAAMVKEGLLERQPDPADGRASLVGVTDRGREFFAEIREQRSREMARLLHRWTDEEIETFSRFLDRFSADLSHHLTEGAATAREEQ